MTTTDRTDGSISPDDLAWIVTATEDQLLSAAGSILLGDGSGFGGRDNEHDRSFARDWLDSRLDMIRPVLCSVDVFRDLGGDLTNDILTILPLLATQLDNNTLLTAIVAGIVVRRGLSRFCAAE